MKKVTLKWLVLENWRAQNRRLDFSDKTVIRAANGKGKSSTFDAFLWLLTGVDAQNRTNYDLYDNTKEFSHENAVPAVVEGGFEVDGMEYVLKRQAVQKWTRKRGKAEYEKAKSDDYTYYINGLAVSAKNYNERVSALFADIEKMKLMLNVRMYQQLDWKVLRKHFSDMVGEVKKEELMGDYSIIEPLLAQYENDPTFTGEPIEAVMSKLRQEIAPLKKDEEKDEAEIEGMKKMLPTLDGIDEAKQAIEGKRKRIEEIDREIVGMGDANKPFIEKRNAELIAIAKKEREIESARSEWDEKQAEPIKELRRRLIDLQDENRKIGEANDAAKHRKAAIERQIEAAKQQYEYFDKERDRLKNDKDEAQGRVFDENQVCPTCGQTLPYERIAELKKQFYDRRDNDVADIIERGKKVRAMRDEQTAIMANLEKELAEIKIEPLQDTPYLEAEIEVTKAKKRPFDDSALKTELEQMRNNLTVIPELDTDKLLLEKSSLNKEIDKLQQIVAKESKRQDELDKIAAAVAALKEKAIARAQKEGLLSKCIEREREWAGIVRARANKYLNNCQVEMTEISKSGELIDVCTVTVDGVDVRVANTARQIIAGIDIANAFQRYAGIEMPLFIDNAEQICDCNMPSVDNQLMLTYVDESYPELTVIV